MLWEIFSGRRGWEKIKYRYYMVGKGKTKGKKDGDDRVNRGQCFGSGKDFLPKNVFKNLLKVINVSFFLFKLFKGLLRNHLGLVEVSAPQHFVGYIRNVPVPVP